jgi:hypothetical protein
MGKREYEERRGEGQNGLNVSELGGLVAKCAARLQDGCFGFMGVVLPCQQL